MGLSKQKIALLHVAAQKLGLDDETYRAALLAHGGVRSAKDLDWKGFRDVMSHFERAGFVSEAAKRRAKRPGMASDSEIGMIRGLWLDLAGTYYQPGNEWKALRGFLRKRFRVAHENFLTARKAYEVIEAIKAITERTGESVKRRSGDVG